MISRNPKALYILRNLEKFKNSIFLFANLLQISTIFKEAVQVRKSSYWRIYQLPKALRLHKYVLQNNFCNIVFGFHCFHLLR